MPVTHRRRTALLAIILTCVALTPPAAAAQAQRADTLTISRTTGGTIVTGQAVAFDGVASPRLRGKTVQLQRRVGTGPWVTMASVTVPRTGAITAKGRAASGTNSWRFIGRVSPKSPLVSSSVTKVAVFTWYFLTDGRYVADDSMRGGTAVIGGVSYPRSVYSEFYRLGNTDYRDYNLGYKCRRFVSEIGLDDDSNTGASAEFFTTLDGARTSHGNKGLGRASRIDVGVSGVLRIRLETISTASASGYGAFGTARVLCTSRPNPSS